MKKRTKNKTDKTTLLLTALSVLLIAVFLFSGYKLLSTLLEYRKAASTYSDLSGAVVSNRNTAGGASAASSGTPGFSGTPGANTNTGTQARSGGQQTAAQPLEHSPIEVDFSALLARNRDVVGWIYSPDTVINYPVVQGSDNDYYLHRLIDGTWNPSGSIFVDVRNPLCFDGRSAILYGHHMNDGSMFASIVNYKNQAYYNEHPNLYLNTPSGNYRLAVFSGFVTYADSSVYTFDFTDDAEFLDYVGKMKGFSDFNSEVTVAATDRIAVLSTCTYEYDDARYVIFAKMIPIA